MVYRIPQLDIPADNPFKNDVLDRRPVVEFLAGLIGRAGGPFVLTLDSPWGSGKTTLIRMLEVELKRQDYCCIYFNAWQVDYVTDPLVALVGSIDSLASQIPKAVAPFKKKLKKLRNLTSVVAKRTVVAAAKVLTVGALDLDKEVEAAAAALAGGAAGDIVDVFLRERSVLEKFRTELEEAIALLPTAEKKPTLVFFVDEIDRCRPTFAIELLERIKHLFDVPNILFVLSLDKQQLEASISAVYGQNMNAAEYLRRFIDLEYVIPTAKTKKYVDSLLSRFALEEIFARRGKHGDLRYDRDNFRDYFSTLAEATSLSLRAQERCFTRLRVVMDQTPDNHYLHPILVALLIVLKSVKPGLFLGVCRGESSASDVMAYLEALPTGEKLVADRSGILIEAFLIAADNDQERRSATIDRLKGASADNEITEQARRRANEVLEMIGHVGGPFRGEPNLRQISSKIDLAGGLSN